MSFAQEDKIMTTKESLVAAKESVNPTLLKIKQVYSNSPDCHRMYIIVEGKDDVPFYGTKASEYISSNWKTSIIPAGNRNKAVEVYRNLDWSVYDKHKVIFFIDRDLSDYTSEDTPDDINVYVTDKYSIENDLCTLDTFIKTIKYYYGLNDIDDKDENAIEELYNACLTSFNSLAETIMAQILYWKQHHIDSRYSNFKIQKMFEIANNSLSRNQDFASDESLVMELSRQSGVTYTEFDIVAHIDLLSSKHSVAEYIRGKYMLVFFVKMLKYIHQNSESVLPSKKKAIDTIGVGYENALLKLCGIMTSPESLRTFLVRTNDNLQQ